MGESSQAAIVLPPSHSSGQITQEILKAVGMAATIAGAAFWVGVRLTAIETSLESVSKDVSEIKVSVRKHQGLAAHPIALHRIRMLEEKGKSR